LYLPPENAMQCTDQAEVELRSLGVLATCHQAEVLVQMAHEARLIHLAFDDGMDSRLALADDLERALGQALDAEEPDESTAAHGELMRVLDSLRRFGLQVSASVSDLSIDGVLGAVRMTVLTAKLSAA
jgi:hypothetical protein